MTESLLIAVFSVLDLLLFYIFFESILIPMFLIIGIWGARERKIHAAYQFFLYTLLGSVLMLLGIIYIYKEVGTTHVEILLTTHFNENLQKILWLAFFASFAVKVPMVPVHIWFPEAHVEAPTAGSVLLAGILLKLGTYGFLRFSIPMFPEASIYFTPLIYTMSVIAIIYTSLITLRQIDFKKNYCLCFSWTYEFCNIRYIFFKYSRYRRKSSSYVKSWCGFKCVILMCRYFI